MTTVDPGSAVVSRISVTAERRGGQPRRTGQRAFFDCEEGVRYPLAEGEQLLWSGWRRYRDFHYYLTVAIVLVAAAALAASFDLSYGGLLGWIVVLGLLVGTAVERRGFVAGTSYLVTDRKLVFVSQRPPGTEFRWVQLAGLRPPRVRDHGDGTGTIDFRPTATKRRATGRARPGPRSCRS